MLRASKLTARSLARDQARLKAKREREVREALAKHDARVAEAVKPATKAGCE